MTKKKWKPSIHSDEPDPQPPKFWPGDPIVALDDGTTGRVEFARRDRMICCVWDHSGRREWCHEEALEFAPGFQPIRRR